MLKAVIASFIGTFLALAAIGVIAVVVVDRTVDRMVSEISTRIEERVASAKEQAASMMERVRDRVSAEKSRLATALAAGRGKRELLAAFGDCVATSTDAGDRPPAAVERCLQEYAWVQP